MSLAVSLALLLRELNRAFITQRSPENPAPKTTSRERICTQPAESYALMTESLDDSRILQVLTSVGLTSSHGGSTKGVPALGRGNPSAWVLQCVP
jgi:hypothetical protein